MNGFAQLLEAIAFLGLGTGALFTGAVRRTALIGAGLAVAGLCAEAGDASGVHLSGAVTLVLAAEAGWRGRARTGAFAAQLWTSARPLVPAGRNTARWRTLARGRRRTGPVRRMHANTSQEISG